MISKSVFEDTKTIISTTPVVDWLTTRTNSESSLSLVDNKYLTNLLVVGLVAFALVVGFILYTFFYLSWEKKNEEDKLKKAAREVEEMGGVIIESGPKTPRTPQSPDVELRRRIQTPDTPHFKDGNDDRNRDF